MATALLVSSCDLAHVTYLEVRTFFLILLLLTDSLWFEGQLKRTVRKRRTSGKSMEREQKMKKQVEKRLREGAGRERWN